MAQSFTLQPFENAKLTFSFRCVYVNKIEVNDPIARATIDRGSDEARGGNRPHVIFNQTANPVTVVVVHKYKERDDGGHPWLETVGNKTEFPPVDGMQKIQIGFEDQPHGTFQNAVAHVVIY